MKLRKCPECSNMVNPQSDGCPICGCNPRVRLFKRLLGWGLVLAGVAWLTHTYILK